jgi:choice-of-anchor B domain-containing protein
VALVGAALPVSGRSQTSFNMSLVANVPLTTSTDVSADGNLVFVGRSAAGVSIVDVTNLASPVVLSTWRHPTFSQVTNAVRPLDGYLYVSNEGGEPYGLFILDLAVPQSPSLVTGIGPPPFPQLVHNLWAVNNHLYLSGYGKFGGNVVVDVTNPATPEYVTVIPTGIHDNTVVGNTLFIAGGFDGTFLYDITNPASPIQLSHFTATTPDTMYYSHIAWPIDGRYVIQSEEVQRPPQGYGRGSYRVVDFADPQNPVAVFRWYSENAKDNPNITPHNVYVVGQFAYLSYYQDGVRVMDVSDPREPVEVGWYDTYPEPAISLFQGCWGVYPFQGDGRIFASDRSHGLFILSFNGARKSTLQGTVRDALTLLPIPGAGVKTLTANASTFSGPLGSYTLKTGSGTHQVRATAAGYHPAVETVVLTDLGTQVHDFLLIPNSVAVEDQVGDMRASEVRLRLAATPNPAPSGRTAIRITVPGDQAGLPLEIGIYSAAGVRLRTLAREAARAGEHVLPWDGTDEAGHPASAGVYLVRLQVGARVESAKIVLAE